MNLQRGIVVAGLEAGTLDGLAAAILYVICTGKNPLARVSVAGGRLRTL